MKIAISSDHAGYHYKEMIKPFLVAKGHSFEDFGTDSDVSVDYPSFIRAAAAAVQKGSCDRGIVLGGSGNGEAMAANRLKGIRCALCWSRDTALYARKHNDANMLSMGARMISPETALEIVGLWLETPFDGGRHLKRIRQIDEIAGEEGRGDPGAEISSAGNPATQIDQEGTSEAETTDNYDLLIAFRYIKYMEGKNSLEFQVDPGLKAPTVIHAPSLNRWLLEFPEWARDRRDEILTRIEEKTSHMNREFREY